MVDGLKNLLEVNSPIFTRTASLSSSSKIALSIDCNSLRCKIPRCFYFNPNSARSRGVIFLQEEIPGRDSFTASRAPINHRGSKIFDRF